MSSDSLGRRLDDAGVEIELDRDEHVLDAVVLLRIAKLDAEPGQTRLGIGASATCDAIVQSGLLNQAVSIVDGGFEVDEP